MQIDDVFRHLALEFLPSGWTLAPSRRFGVPEGGATRVRIATQDPPRDITGMFAFTFHQPMLSLFSAPPMVLSVVVGFEAGSIGLRQPYRPREPRKRPR